MVLWSYLLLSVPISASIEHVLAPVGPTPPQSSSEPDKSAGQTPMVREETSARPLTERGVDEIDLLAECERQLAEKLQLPGELRLIPVSPLPRLPRTSTLPELVLLDHPSRLTTSSVLLRYRLLDGEKILGNYTTSFRAQVIAQVWAPVRRLTAGDPLTAEDVSAREVDLVREPKAVTVDPAIFSRYELARAAGPEHPLVWADLAPRALVRKGQVVEVVANEGMLSISMKGQATRSGALGEVVTIRNLESKREFPAEVIDENRVRVHF